MTAVAYSLQWISKMQIKVISSRIGLIGWNDSKLNECKSARMSLEPEWAT